MGPGDGLSLTRSRWCSSVVAGRQAGRVRSVGALGRPARAHAAALWPPSPSAEVSEPFLGRACQSMFWAAQARLGRKASALPWVANKWAGTARLLYKGCKIKRRLPLACSCVLGPLLACPWARACGSQHWNQKPPGVSGSARNPQRPPGTHCCAEQTVTGLERALAPAQGPAVGSRGTCLSGGGRGFWGHS